MVVEMKRILYEEQLRRTDLLSLETIWLRSDFLQVYKNIHHIKDVPVNNFFQIKTILRGYQRTYKQCHNNRFDDKTNLVIAQDPDIHQFNPLPPELWSSDK